MDLNWLQSVLFGLISGLMDILPVSAQAHRMLLLKLFGMKAVSSLMMLAIHLGVLMALYMTGSAHLVRMSRAKRLSRVPKKKRKRPLDVKSLLDRSMLMTMLVPVVIGLCAIGYVQEMNKSLVIMAAFLFLNGILVYAPQFLATGNRDSRTLSRVEGLLMGLGGGLSILPGVSGVGAAVSIGSICGVDRGYGLTMALLMNLFLNLGYLVFDVVTIAQAGFGTLSFGIVLRYLLTGLVAFGGTLLGIRTMRRLAEGQGYALFGLYCFGMALFSFILNLMA